MVYKYSPDGNFEDYASGKVLYGMRGCAEFSCAADSGNLPARRRLLPQESGTDGI